MHIGAYRHTCTLHATLSGYYSCVLSVMQGDTIDIDEKIENDSSTALYTVGFGELQGSIDILIINTIILFIGVRRLTLLLCYESYIK